MNETALRSVRLALASLLTTALIAQLIIGLTDSELTVVRFFSYFTVLSNTMAVVALAVLAFRPGSDATSGFATYRGAVTAYMGVTGLVWAAVLLPNYVDVGAPEPWIDWSIHIIGPVLMAADWLVNPPPVRLEKRVLAIWLIFPLAYVTYSLIRGPMADWYPYPFLDPTEQGGYDGVAIGVALVAAVILGFSFAVYWWANRSGGRRA